MKDSGQKSKSDNMPCRHIYEYTGLDICPDCGGYTHETNFSETAALHKQHLADGKDAPYKCPDCGGTIRGWWDI